MKYLSIGVPSYNSEGYLIQCIDSLLVGGEDVEIIIINDGSTDKTLEIARDYQKKYPSIVKVVDQENMGHGEGVNQGLAHSTGLYYKVVDSDDHLLKNGYLKLLKTIKEHLKEGLSPDAYICNFVYDHAIDGTKNVSSYDKHIKPNAFVDWNRITKMHFSKMILMHSLIFRRDILIESGVILPKHCFYVDNYFAYKPLIISKIVYYLDVDLYSYFIGRSDQSINITNFSKRYNQQLIVMNLMIDAIKYEDIKKLPRWKRNYLKHALNVVNIVTIAFIVLGDRNLKEQFNDVKRHFASIKAKDKKMYYFLRYRSYYTVVPLFIFKYLKKKIIHYGYNQTCKKAKVG